MFRSLHTEGRREAALHSAYLPPSWLWNPWLRPPQPSFPQTQSPSLFHLSLDHLPACHYIFPNSMTPFWRHRTTPVVALVFSMEAHHGFLQQEKYSHCLVLNNLLHDAQDFLGFFACCCTLSWWFRRLILNWFIQLNCTNQAWIHLYIFPSLLWLSVPCRFCTFYMFLQPANSWPHLFN